ncbi:ABC transporter permease [Saccharomonospora halophila]|uniref:ABC transporter permease n=1 Tax=Saccharomonospora halophila TaxID=129922 RepID=UPI000362460F|nr:ABC transporter permease [Saccharomonospora halophila]
MTRLSGRTREHNRPARLALSDLLGLGLLGIRTRPLRAVLSALGISIGIATMITVIAIPASSQQKLNNELDELGTNMLTAQAQSVPGEQEQVTLPKQSVDMVRRIGPVTTASAVGNTHAKVRRSDLVNPAYGSGLAVLASKNNLLRTVNGTMRAGRFLDNTTDGLPTVILGHVAAKRLGISRLRSGEPAPLVVIDNQWFTVSGILAELKLYPQLGRAVLVGWDSARKFLDFDGHPTVVYTQAQEGHVSAVRGVLSETVHPKLPGMIRVSDPSAALAAKRAAESTFSELFLALAGVALLVGAIGVANTMVISVLERRREIGLRRALGAHRGQIRAQFLTESVALSGLGGLAGTLLGVLATIGYTVAANWPVVISPLAVLAGVGGAIAVGALAGVYPSIRAARLPPTAALAAS